MSAAPRIVALVGLRGAGKSSIARALAPLLRARFLDLDREIARIARTHGSAPARAGALLRRLGEPEFRRIERLALEAALERDGGWVIATGGGVVEGAAARAMLLERARVVWIDPDRDELVRRLERSGEDRPRLTDARSLAGEVALLDERRRPQYAQLAHHRVSGAEASRGPAEIARAIASALDVAVLEPTRERGPLARSSRRRYPPREVDGANG